MNYLLMDGIDLKKCRVRVRVRFRVGLGLGSWFGFGFGLELGLPRELFVRAMVVACTIEC